MMRVRPHLLALALGIFFILALQGANSFKYEYENKVDGTRDIFFYSVGYIDDGNYLLANASMVDAPKAWGYTGGTNIVNVTVYCRGGMEVGESERTLSPNNECGGNGTEVISADRSRITFNKLCGLRSSWYENFKVQCRASSGRTTLSQIHTDQLAAERFPPQKAFDINLNVDKKYPNSTSVAEVFHPDLNVGGGIDKEVTVRCPYPSTDSRWESYNGPLVLGWKYSRLPDDSGSCDLNGQEVVGTDNVKFKFRCTEVGGPSVPEPWHMSFNLTCKDPFPFPSVDRTSGGQRSFLGVTSAHPPIFETPSCSEPSKTLNFAADASYQYYNYKFTCSPPGVYRLFNSTCASSTCTDNARFDVPVRVLYIQEGQIKLSPPDLWVRTGEAGFVNPGTVLIQADAGSKCSTNYLNLPCSVVNGVVNWRVALGLVPNIWELKVNYTFSNGEAVARWWPQYSFDFDARSHPEPTARLDYLTTLDSYELRANHTRAEAAVAVYDALSFNDSNQFPANAPACSTTPFGDVVINYWACPEITKLKQSGVITDSEQFNPATLATRAQAAFWITKGKIAISEGMMLPQCTQKFSDVSCTRSDAREINYVADTVGIANVKCGGTTPFGGADPYKFCPDFTVARADMAGWLRGVLGTVTNYQTYFDSNDQRVSTSRQDTIVLAKMGECTTNAECVAQHGQGWTCNLQSGVCEPPGPVTCNNPIPPFNQLGAVINNYCFNDSNGALGPADKVWKCVMPTQGTEGAWVETTCGTTCSFDASNNPIPPPTTAIGLCARNLVKNQCDDANGAPPAFCVAAGGGCGNGACDSGENANTCPGDCDPVCGNGVIEREGQNVEDCEGRNLNGETCASQEPGSTGALKCDERTCKFDKSDCRFVDCESYTSLNSCLAKSCVWYEQQPAPKCKLCDYWTACWDYDNSQTCDGTGTGGNPSLSNPCGIYLWAGKEGKCVWDNNQVAGQRCVFKPTNPGVGDPSTYVGNIRWGECLRGERTGTQTVLDAQGNPSSIQVTAKCPSIIPIAFITKETAIMIIMLLIAYYFYTMKRGKKGEKVDSRKAKGRKR